MPIEENRRNPDKIPKLLPAVRISMEVGLRVGLRQGVECRVRGLSSRQNHRVEERTEAGASAGIDEDKRRAIGLEAGGKGDIRLKLLPGLLACQQASSRARGM